MIATRITRPATHYRFVESVKDPAGDPVDTFADGVPIYVELQQTGAMEMRGGQLLSVTSWQVFLRPDAVISGLDQLDIDGDRYTFDGDPWLVRNPRTGINSHWQGRMRKVE